MAASRAEELFAVDGRVAVVTGASSGIGARFAAVLAQAGASVVIGARRVERLESIARALQENGAEVTPVACDVTSTRDLDHLIGTAIERYGRLDLMINNAGVAPAEDPEPETVSSFEEVIGINLTGLWAGARAASGPMLYQGRGAIINMASISGLVAGDGHDTPSYSASKGAVVNLTRELAVRWAPHGVRVNAIAPAWFRTDMNSAVLDDPEGAAFVAARTPIGRPGELPELDGALLYLASDASSYVTGQTLVIDGGWTAR
jgi:NAD(P)-dependent dehydrogenase (short-subunit alcohol dehydrogenase family)